MHLFLIPVLLLSLSHDGVQGFSGLWMSNQDDDIEGIWEMPGECPYGAVATRVTGAFGFDATKQDRMGLFRLDMYCNGDLGLGEGITSGNGEGIPEPNGDFDLSCPVGDSKIQKHIYAVRVRVDRYGDGQDVRGINGIQIYCKDKNQKRIYAKQGAHDAEAVEPLTGVERGRWSHPVQCRDDHSVCGFQTLVQGAQGTGDDIGINSIRLRCCRYDWPTMPAVVAAGDNSAPGEVETTAVEVANEIVELET